MVDAAVGRDTRATVLGMSMAKKERTTNKARVHGLSLLTLLRTNHMRSYDWQKE